MNSLKTTPKDFFFHVGALIALYTSVAALLNLVFSIINYYFPDQLAGYFISRSIAWPISVLIILVPVLYILEYFLVKDIRLNPEKKNLWIRRWRIFLTLFLTGITIACTLIALINVYLSGEIGARFVWKVVAVLIVTTTVFKYYFFSINEKWKYAVSMRKGHAWFGILIVLAAIVGGFIVVGSPAKQRALRYDQQRLSELQSIQWQVLDYWQRKEKLPVTLADLNDTISGGRPLVDPETKQPYEYAVKTPTSFELCATFGLPTEDNEGRGEYGYGGGGFMAMPTRVYYDGGGIIEDENWKHEAGRSCFTRTIDPERYPPIGKPRPL